VGEDAQGKTLRGMLIRLGIDTAGLRIDSQRPTTSKTRIIAHNQQVVRLTERTRAPYHWRWSKTSWSGFAVSARR